MKWLFNKIKRIIDDWKMGKAWKGIERLSKRILDDNPQLQTVLDDSLRLLLYGDPNMKREVPPDVEFLSLDVLVEDMDKKKEKGGVGE